MPFSETKASSCLIDNYQLININESNAKDETDHVTGKIEPTSGK